MLVAAKTNGATPLVMACRNGHYDVAEYLIEHCKADVEQLGSGKIFLSRDKIQFPQYSSSWLIANNHVLFTHRR
jgi:ankyrin repeat protein